MCVCECVSPSLWLCLGLCICFFGVFVFACCLCCTHACLFVLYLYLHLYVCMCLRLSTQTQTALSLAFELSMARELAHLLDSLVRFSGRVEENHVISEPARHAHLTNACDKGHPQVSIAAGEQKHRKHSYTCVQKAYAFTHTASENSHSLSQALGSIRSPLNDFKHF